MSAALRQREEQAIGRLACALSVNFNPGALRADELEQLADAAEKLPPVDKYNPTRRLYQGEPFPVYGRLTAYSADCAVCTTDLAYAQAGELGYDTTPSTEIFEDCLIEVLRADLERLRNPDKG